MQPSNLFAIGVQVSTITSHHILSPVWCRRHGNHEHNHGCRYSWLLRVCTPSCCAGRGPPLCPQERPRAVLHALSAETVLAHPHLQCMARVAPRRLTTACMTSRASRTSMGRCVCLLSHETLFGALYFGSSCDQPVTTTRCMLKIVADHPFAGCRMSHLPILGTRYQRQWLSSIQLTSCRANHLKLSRPGCRSSW